MIIVIRIKFKYAVLTLVAFGFCALCLIFSAETLEGIRQGLALCGEIVIPSLFPFMAIAGFIMRSGIADFIASGLSRIITPIWRIPSGAVAAFLLSFFAGYPVGATMVRDLHKRGIITRNQAERMLCFTVNAGPAMIVFAVGVGMFGSVKLGWILFASNTAAALVFGFILALFSQKAERKETTPEVPPSVSGAFVESVAGASDSMLTVCAFVMLFAALIQISGALSPELSSSFAAVAEVTNGCLAVTKYGLPAAAFVLGWSGLSVQCQVLALSGGLISYPKLALSRLAQGGISFLLCSLFCRGNDTAVTVFSSGDKIIGSASVSGIPASIALLLLSVICLWACSHRDSHLLPPKKFSAGHIDRNLL